MMRMKSLAVAIVLALLSFSFLSPSQASETLELKFQADNAKDEEIKSQTFSVNGYRRVYAEIPVDKYDFAEIILNLDLKGNLTCKGFVVYGSRYTGAVDLKSQKVLLHNPSDLDSRVELQFFGIGEVKIKSSKVRILKPDYRFDGEKYIAYLFVKELSSDSGFKSELKIFSKTDLDSVTYTTTLRYFGWSVFSKSKSVASTKFSEGKLNSLEVEIPSRYFISPGIYTIAIKSDEWSYERGYFVPPGVNSIVTFIMLVFGVCISYRYRREIYREFLKLSVGQRFVFFAIVLLILSAITLAFDDEAKANSIAILSYFLLVVGVGNLVVEYLLEERGHKNTHQHPRIAIGLGVLSLFTHYTQELLKFFPYLDVVFFALAILVSLKPIRDRFVSSTDPPQEE
jgi:hypothetical protein